MPESVDTLSQVFAALADPTRRAILARLARGEASVTELAAPFSMSMAAVSKHLKVLERAGLITRGRDAQWRPCRLEAAALKDATDWLERYRQYWDLSLDRLDAHLSEIQIRKPKMTAVQRKFTLVREFDAPRDLVYRVWTEPEHMSQWLLPSGVTTPQESISQDLQVGGFWNWTMVNNQDGTRYPTVAEFREIVEPERLVFTWGDENDQPALITVTFAEHGGGTRLTLHLTGPAEMVTDESGVEEGWNECLDSLELFLARRLERR